MKDKPVAWDLKIYELANRTSYEEQETVRDLNRIQKDTLEVILKRHHIKHQFLGVDAKGERCI